MRKNLEKEWRQNDLDVIMSPEFKNALKDNNIIRVTWKQIRGVMYPDISK